MFRLAALGIRMEMEAGRLGQFLEGRGGAG